MGKSGKNNRFNSPKNDFDNLKDDVKKVGYDIRDLYKKNNINIPKPKPKPGGEKTEIGRWIIISAIILILIMSKVGIPFAIIILIFILVLLLYR